MDKSERISSFIRSYIHDDEGILGEIYADAVSRGVPVIRPETREFIKTQIMLAKPANVLEIGTAVGYSALYMIGHMPADGHITTIELSAERASEARRNIALCGRDKQIEVCEGDAAEVLKKLDGSYDMAFVDAAKGQYMVYLPEVMRLVRAGGVIISDNILQEGEVLESHFTVAKRDRTIHDRMREYIYELMNNGELATSIIPVGDGVAVSVRL